MDTSKFVRDKKYVLSKLKKGDALVADADLEIHLLEALRGNELIKFGETTEIIGSFAIVVNGRYAVWNAPTIYNTKPFRTESVSINDQDHIVLSYKKGDKVLESLTTLAAAGLVYLTMQIYIFQGKLPWFYGPGDVTKFFSITGKYANITTDGNPELFSLLEALMTRLDTDDSVMIKNSGLPVAKWSAKRKYIPLKSPAFLLSTMGKIVGNYQAEGMRAAMISEPTEVGMLERIMRS